MFSFLFLCQNLWKPMDLKILKGRSPVSHDSPGHHQRHWITTRTGGNVGGILSFAHSPYEVLISIAMFRYSSTIKIHKYSVFIIVAHEYRLYSVRYSGEMAWPPYNHGEIAAAIWGMVWYHWVVATFIREGPKLDMTLAHSPRESRHITNV